MAARIDVSSASAILKEYYTDQRVAQMTYRNCPFYAMVPKYKDFRGEKYPLPMRVTNPQGRSATFATAQSNKVSSNYKSFLLDRAKDYAIASIDSESIMASQTDPGAFLKLATAEVDGSLDSLKRSLGWALYGSGTGELGQVNAEPSTNTGDFEITLKNTEDIVKFEVGQTLVIYSATSGGSQRSSDGSDNEWAVKAVNRDDGKITLTGDYDASGDIAADDYIFVEGDRGNKLTGLSGWLPGTAPTSGDSHFGVDRSVDATRLGGVRVTASGKPIDEAYTDAARRAGREGGEPNVGFLDFSKYANLEKSLGSRVRYTRTDVNVGKSATVGFEGIEISGPTGPIHLYPDRDCPNDRSYLLEMDYWGLYSLGEPVQLLDLDGNSMLRESSADAYEVRCASYSQLGCSFPGSSVVLKF